MPVASGAAGRVDVGVNAGTTWSPDGVKRKPAAANRSCDSYLQRYKDLQKTKKNKCGVLQVSTVPQNNTAEPCDGDDGGDKEEKLQENGGSEGQDSEKPVGTKKSKNSRVCCLL